MLWPQNAAKQSQRLKSSSCSHAPQHALQDGSTVFLLSLRMTSRSLETISPTRVVLWLRKEAPVR